MLNHSHFYHGGVKNIIMMFGAIFSDITIRRAANLGAADYQEISVPLSYAPKQRAYVRTTQNPVIEERQKQVVLPRISYEIVNFAYDPSRRTNMSSVARSTRTNTESNKNMVAQLMSPTPYDIKVNLYVYVKNQDDGLQIIEQVLPFFNPDFNVSIRPVPEMQHIVEDVPIILDSVSYEDDYEGDLETRRAIIWTLSFTVKMNFYGPITKAGVIKKVSINVTNEDSPDLLKYKATVDPISAEINDPHKIVEEFLYGS